MRSTHFQSQALVHSKQLPRSAASRSPECASGTTAAASRILGTGYRSRRYPLSVSAATTQANNTIYKYTV